MKISNVKTLVAAIAAIVSLAVNAKAVVIDFESYSGGTVVSGAGAVNTDLTFSSVGRSILVYDGIPGPAFTGTKSALGGPSDDAFVGNPFRADFLIAGINSVSVVLGDWAGDSDSLYLWAYNSSNSLLASDSDFISSSFEGGLTLSLATGGTDIAYVLFGSTGQFANSVAFDNFTYNQRQGETQGVPDAGTSLALVGLGFFGLAASRRFLRTNVVR